METVLLVIHLLIAVALVAVVLLQRSEGGALGIGGGSGGGGGAGLMSARGTANILTRTTAILAACFFVSSIALAILASETRQPSSVLDAAPATTVPQETQSDQPQVPVPGSD